MQPSSSTTAARHASGKNQLRAGFTLIELLVVIAIIGLLASLAVPAFNRFRQEGYKTACASNLRQIGTACENYMNKYRMYPWSKRGDGGAVPTIGDDTEVRKCLELLYKYDYIDNPKVYGCPADGLWQEPRRIDDVNERRDDFFLDETHCSYTYRSRPITISSPSTTPVSGDKRGGDSEYAHHRDGRNVLFRNATVEFIENARLNDANDEVAQKIRAELVGFGTGGF
ncbi:MAG: hypothetical protein KatS3mg102_2024 [Planctomycetota bacterium]|nr:MAG: hypothetical protein KatS3mg102_2024 [Planctomycetota bacterium]